MKITVDIDATPQELRTFFGLPDLEPFHEELVRLLTERMSAGTEGYDPLALMSALLPQGAQSLEAIQKVFWETMRQGFDLAKAGAAGRAPGK